MNEKVNNLFVGMTEQQKVSAVLAMIVICNEIAEKEGIKVDKRVANFAYTIKENVHRKENERTR